MNPSTSIQLSLNTNFFISPNFCFTLIFRHHIAISHFFHFFSLFTVLFFNFRYHFLMYKIGIQV